METTGNLCVWTAAAIWIEYFLALTKRIFEMAYEDHVRRQNAEYVLAFSDFEKGLSDEDRALLGGAAEPDVEDYTARESRRIFLGSKQDAAETAACGEWPVFVDSSEDELREEFPNLSASDARGLAERIEGLVARKTAEANAASLASIVGVFLSAGSLRLQAAALAFSIGSPSVSGYRSMAQWACGNGLSRAAVSKAAKAWQKLLGLPAGPHLKTVEACKVYSAAQAKNHWRQRIS